MSKSIVMIAVPSEDWPKPVEERGARIGVMSAYAKQNDVQGDQRVAKRGETKTRVGRDEKNGADNPGNCLQPPGEAIEWPPTRPDEHNRSREEQGEMEWGNTGLHFSR